MPYIRIWIHLIFSTKNREPLITNDINKLITEHIRTNAKEKGIYVDYINAVADHIHILVSLESEQSISKVAQLIKGESSYWINKNKITKSKFEWQDEYIALSVSESVVSKVRKYIENQQKHHRKTTFMEEYNAVLKIHNMQH